MRGPLTDEEIALGWAFSARCWAARRCPSAPGRTNFGELARRAALAAGGGAEGRSALLDGLGANPMHWPALSRWLVMALPWYAAEASPPRCAPLDSDRGRAAMRRWFPPGCGDGPRVPSWLHALPAVGGADAAGRAPSRPRAGAGERRVP